MNTTEIKGHRNVIGGILKQHWSRLRRNEAGRAEGRFTEIMGRAELRTGKTCRLLNIPLGRPISPIRPILQVRTNPNPLLVAEPGGPSPAA